MRDAKTGSIAAIFLTIAVFPLIAQEEIPTTDQAQIDTAIDKVYPALVRVHVVATRPSSGRMEKYGGTGSGTIIHPDGYVITNHHVAGKGTRIWCRLSDKSKVDATLVGTDPQTDLCIIKLNMNQVPESLKPLPIAKFGDVNKIEVGDTVLAMGSPAGVSQSVTVGVVANLEMITPSNSSSMTQDDERVGDLVRWIGHDAVIYFGNSGGPLVNLDGDIVGVNEIGLGSLGGAIPADIASFVADQLIENKTVNRSWTGIEAQPLLKSFSRGIQGVLVSGVNKGSPAKKAGIEPGDIITSFDGIPIDVRVPEHLPLFNRVVLGTPVGTEVEVSVLRESVSKTFKLKTELRSKARGEDLELKSWGVTARDLTRRSVIRMGRDDENGVLISSISAAGPAAKAKPPLRRGDIVLTVGGNSTHSISDLLAASGKLASASEDVKAVPALVEFERNDKLYATVVEIGKELNVSKSSAAEKAWIGLNTQVLTRKLAEVIGLKGKKGVRITQVLPGTKAEAAGFKRGDILLKVDGDVIRAEREKDSGVFNSMIRDYPVDETAVFDVVRGSEKLKIECELEPAPVATSEFEFYEDESLEFVARELSRANTDEFEAQTGVYIKTVELAGWAALAGLKSGDIMKEVNDTPINSIEDLKAVMKGIAERKDEFVVLFVIRKGKTRYIEIHPVWKVQTTSS